MDKKKATPNTEAAPESHPQSTSTVRAQILSRLMDGERITSGDAWRDYGSSRLSAVIHWLKQAGYPIHSRTITVPAKGGRLARISEYWMDSSHAKQRPA